jgi:L-rhamnose isomerase
MLPVAAATSISAVSPTVVGATITVGPILARARADNGGAVGPIATYRASKYRARVTARPAAKGGGGGIV